MKPILLFTFLIAFSIPTFSQGWANFDRYMEDNKEIENCTAVFMGNSITQGWAQMLPDFFSENNYVGRGISGQTTSQMLVRFRPDVIDLNPKVVVILAGTNDIAENNGPISLEHICGNIISMCELAKQNNIKVVLCSVLPATDYNWSPGKNPKEKIPVLNQLINEYAQKEDIQYVDYYSAMVDENRGLDTRYANDGVHPTKAGFDVMMPLVKEAIDKILQNGN